MVFGWRDYISAAIYSLILGFYEGNDVDRSKNREIPPTSVPQSGTTAWQATSPGMIKARQEMVARLSGR